MKTIQPIQTLKYPLIWLTGFLILGIVIGYYLEVPLLFSSILTGSSVFVLCLIHFLGYQSIFQKRVFHLAVGFCFTGLGIFQFQFTQPILNPKHFVHFEQDSLSIYHAVVQNQLKSNPYQFQYLVELQSQNKEVRTGNILLKIPKSDLEPALKAGNIIAFTGTIQPIPSPKNPYQFDYAEYQKTKGVYGQVTSKLENIQNLGIKKNMPYYFGTLRNHIQEGFEQAEFSETNKGILMALLIGNRQLIDKQTSDEYTNAGAIHVLAISGLHIGILLYFFSILLKPLGRKKQGRIAQLVLQLIFLWSFAILAGMSASVVRAVTMFSFMSIGYQIMRGVNIYNTLAASAFILLLFKPNFLFDVGFQMSYTAVLGIVSIQPYFQKKWHFNNRIVQYFYEILTVSIAAQLALLPLCLYYFHQFPGLFLLTNLLVIPLITLALLCGLLCIFILTFASIPDFFAQSIDAFLTFLNRYIAWIAQQDDFLFKEIPFHLSWIVISVLFLISFILFTFHKQKKMIFGMLTAIILFQISWFYLYQIQPKTELLVLHRYKNNQILVNQRGNIISYQNDPLELNQKLISAYEMGSFSEIHKQDSMPSMIQFKNHRILVIDSLGLVPEARFSHWIITQSPKINLERLLQKNQPQCIVVDGSNKSYLTKVWKATCEKKGIDFHDTFEQGYFRLK